MARISGFVVSCFILFLPNFRVLLEFCFNKSLVVSLNRNLSKACGIFAYNGYHTKNQLVDVGTHELIVRSFL